MDVSVMLQMMQVCDSLFPIGAFTMSNGLETFVLKGKLHTEAQLKSYIDSYFSILPYNDLGTMMLAYTHSEDTAYLKELDTYSFCLKIPREVRQGSQKLCSRFLKICKDFENLYRLEEYQKWIQEKQCYGSHALAMGLYAKEVGAEIEQAAAVYVYSLLSAMVTNAVKTIPLSQMTGQQILHQKLADIHTCIRQAKEVKMSDLGIGGTEFDIEAMNHETLYSRMYMS